MDLIDFIGVINCGRVVAERVTSGKRKWRPAGIWQDMAMRQEEQWKREREESFSCSSAAVSYTAPSVTVTAPGAESVVVNITYNK